MEFLVIAGILFAVIMMMPNKGGPGSKEYRCDIHKWAYNHKGDMVCNKCDFNPSTELNTPTEQDED